MRFADGKKQYNKALKIFRNILHIRPLLYSDIVGELKKSLKKQHQNREHSASRARFHRTRSSRISTSRSILFHSMSVSDDIFLPSYSSSPSANATKDSPPFYGFKHECIGSMDEDSENDGR